VQCVDASDHEDIVYLRLTAAEVPKDEQRNPAHGALDLIPY